MQDSLSHAHEKERGSCVGIEVGVDPLLVPQEVVNCLPFAPIGPDPARFSFAHGGKVGHPYPVDREAYDKTIDVLHNALEGSKVDRSEKVAAFRRLATFADAEGAMESRHR